MPRRPDMLRPSACALSCASIAAIALLFIPLVVRAGSPEPALPATQNSAYSHSAPAGADRTDYCALAKSYCDRMHTAASAELQQQLAKKALACALRAVQTNPTNATAHLCVAVCYAKNFPYADIRTRVKWSKAIKEECETGIALDPKQDVGYYLLGRWEAGVAGMNRLTQAFVKIIYGGLPPASNAEAIKDFQQAIRLAPHRIIHHFELAKVYVTTGQRPLARAQLVICSTLKPLDQDDADAQADALKLLAQTGK